MLTYLAKVYIFIHHLTRRVNDIVTLCVNTNVHNSILYLYCLTFAIRKTSSHTVYNTLLGLNYDTKDDICQDNRSNFNQKKDNCQLFKL